MTDIVYGILLALNEVITEYVENPGQVDLRMIWITNEPYTETLRTIEIPLGSHKISLVRECSEIPTSSEGEYKREEVSYVVIDKKQLCSIDLNAPNSARETIERYCIKYLE